MLVLKWLVIWVEFFVKVSILLFLRIKLWFSGILYCLVSLVWIFNIWYLLWIGIKNFGFISCSISFCFFWLLWLDVWMLLILLWMIFVLVFLSLLIMWLIFNVLLGIGEFEKIMVLLGLIEIWWWVLLVICESVVIGLFWELVYRIMILLVGRECKLLVLMMVLLGMFK